MPASNFIAHNPAALWQVPDAVRSVYSHAAEVAAPSRVLFISGQFGVAPDGRLPADSAAQCERAMDNVEALLAAAGMTTANIVKLTTANIVKLTYYASKTKTDKDDGSHIKDLQKVKQFVSLAKSW